jgi:di/tricarboxylate transporter
MQSGLAEAIGRGILRVSGTNPARLTFVIMLTVGLISAFISNTGTVAVLLPAIITLTRRTKMNPSRLLMPMAFGSSLGGALTLIGTPPNLIVSDLLREHGHQNFGFFDFAPIGLLVLAGGVIFTLLVGRHLLPDRHNPPEHKTGAERTEPDTPEQPDMALSGQMAYLRLQEGSALAGKTLAEAGLRGQFGVNVLEIQSGSASRESHWRKLRGALQPQKEDRESALRQHRFQTGETLVVQGEEKQIERLASAWMLRIESVVEEQLVPAIGRESGLAEVLLLPYSMLEGKDLVESQFGSTYNVTVLGIERPGASDPLPTRGVPLRFGDTLLVQGARADIQALRSRRRNFVVLSQMFEEDSALDFSKALTTLLILAGMMVALVSGLLSIAPASMLAALAIILTGCLKIDEAYRSIDWKSIVLIAGMLPMAIALEKVGLVNVVAGGLVAGLGTLGPVWVTAGFFILTSLFTQVLSNTTTAVLVAPIAFIAADKLGVQPQAFLMAVALAASMSFATPVSSPVNTLVMGAGGYRFSDYIRVGVPLILVCMLVAMLALPVFWPF